MVKSVYIHVHVLVKYTDMEICRQACMVKLEYQGNKLAVHSESGEAGLRGQA